MKFTSGLKHPSLLFLVETTGVEPVVPFGLRMYSPLGLPIFLHLHEFVRDYTAFSTSYVVPNFCPVTAFSANDTFQTPTGPTYFRIVTF